MHRRRAARAPLELSRDAVAYPFERVFSAADRASRGRPDDVHELVAGLRDTDPAVRYWSAVGIRLRGAEAVRAQAIPLRALLIDAEPAPRVAGADALLTVGDDAGLEVLIGLSDYRAQGRHAAMLALDTLVAHGRLDDQARARVQALPRPGADTPQREREYIPRLLDALKGPAR